MGVKQGICALAAVAVPSFGWTSAAAQDAAVATALSRTAKEPGCRSDDPKEVVVCGRSQQRYRIDPSVLAATRAAEALPPKPALDATAAGPCTGSQCGGGDFVPLIPMALKALTAAELAAKGDDWREAFRTRPDEYEAYKRAQQPKKGVSIGITVGHQ